MPSDPSATAKRVNDEFLKDLHILTSEAHHKRRGNYLETMMAALRDGTPEVSSSVRAAFATDHNLKLANVKRAFRVLAVLSQWVGSFKETDDAFRREQKKLEDTLEDDEKIERFRDFVDELVSMRKLIKQGFETAKLVDGVLPMFKGILHTVDARVIWEGKDQEKLKLVPVASLLLDLDSGDPDRLTFQITPQKLDDLLTQLNEIKEQMTKLSQMLDQEKHA